MGNCSLQADRTETFKEMGKWDFSFKQIVGRGGFGKVKVSEEDICRSGK